MIKRISLVAFLSLGAMYYAQDASVIKNTAEVYSGSNFGGTAKFNSMAGSMGALGGDLSAITVNPESQNTLELFSHEYVDPPNP